MNGINSGEVAGAAIEIAALSDSDDASKPTSKPTSEPIVSERFISSLLLVDPSGRVVSGRRIDTSAPRLSSDDPGQG